MAASPDMMQQLMSQMGAGGGAGGTTPGGAPGMPGGAGQPGAAPGGQPPRAAPMSTPQDKKGLKAAAQTNVHIAANMLEKALPSFGSESPEGQAILEILKKLGKLFGKPDSGDLVPAEIMQLVSKMPQMGGGGQLQQMIKQMMMKAQAGGQQQQQQPMGAGAMGG